MVCYNQMAIIRCLCIVGLLLVFISAQNFGNITDYHMPITWQSCTGVGSCTSVQGALVLDQNWRWLHYNSSTTNCFTGSWSCGDPTTCTNNCQLEGITQDQWASPYGMSSIGCGQGIQINLVTVGQYSTNIGARIYLLASTANDSNYQTFKLLNRQFSFDVDVSKVECGLNGALYFVEMDSDGGKSKYSTNKAGAYLGTGYCDAQCPKDIKYIQGVANSQGTYGSCCPEFDIWQANKWANAFTAHPCTTTGGFKCSGTTCDTQCDKAGCDINPFRNGNKTFYGPSTTTKKYTIDTTQPFTVVTRFITDTGTDTGNLKSVQRYYIQNGKKFIQPPARLSVLPKYNNINDTNCKVQFLKFGDTNTLASHGGMTQMGKSMQNGMVLVLSLWDDHTAKMHWLDSVYPDGSDITKPGNYRGPCPTTGGDAATIQSTYPNAYVRYTNIKFGTIGSTN